MKIERRSVVANSSPLLFCFLAWVGGATRFIMHSSTASFSDKRLQKSPVNVYWSPGPPPVGRNRSLIL